MNKTLRAGRAALAASILAAISGALVLSNHTAADSPSRMVTPNQEQVCAGTHQFPAGDAPTVTVTAPDGFLISGYCVKAGSSSQGNGPEYETVDPPQKTVTFSHSSGKNISHYVIYYTEVPPPSTDPPTSPPSTDPPTSPPSTDPPTTDPSPTDPPTSPPSTDPPTTDPSPTDPPTTDPSPTDPSPTDPVTTDPSPTDPATTDSSPTTEPSSSVLGVTPTPPASTDPTSPPTLAPLLGQLPETGSSSAPFVVIGAMFVAAGALTLLAARRFATH